MLNFQDKHYDFVKQALLMRQKYFSSMDAVEDVARGVLNEKEIIKQVHSSNKILMVNTDKWSKLSCHFAIGC